MQSYEYRSRMTFGVQILLIINIAVFVAERLLDIPLRSIFALHANWLERLAPWQLITYQFAHANFSHILFNMVTLFFIGPDIENRLGTNRFFALYLLSGLIGGLGWAALSPSYSSCVGASGAVLGILGAYAAFYPNRKLYIWGVLPIRTLTFAILLAIINLYQMHNPSGNIANAAHLGGGLAGYIYAALIDRPAFVRKLKNEFLSRKNNFDKKEIDRILDKVSEHGLHSLSKKEREILKRSGNQKR